MDYRKYLERLKQMDGRELTDEVEEKRRDLEEGGTDAEIRFILAKNILAENTER